MSGQNKDPLIEWFSWLLLTGILFSVPVLLWWVFPSFRFGIMLCYIVLKTCVSALTFHFYNVKELWGFLKFYTNLGQQVSFNSINYGEVFRTVNKLAAHPLWIVTEVFSVWLILIFKGKKKRISEEKVIEIWKKKSLRDICREWDIGVDERIFLNPDQAVEELRKVREKKNVPPSIIARKIEDPVARNAILYYDRYSNKKELMALIYNPKTIQEITIKSLKATEKE